MEKKHMFARWEGKCTGCAFEFCSIGGMLLQLLSIWTTAQTDRSTKSTWIGFRSISTTSLAAPGLLPVCSASLANSPTPSSSVWTQWRLSSCCSGFDCRSCCCCWCCSGCATPAHTVGHLLMVSGVPPRRRPVRPPSARRPVCVREKNTHTHTRTDIQTDNRRSGQWISLSVLKQMAKHANEPWRAYRFVIKEEQDRRQ